MLTISDLYAQADSTEILQGIELSVSPKELHLILGLNGSGKSTLGKVLMGSSEYTVTKGSIRFLGEEISQMPTFERAQKGIFLSHQTPPALDGISLKDMLRASEKENITMEKRSILHFKKALGQTLESVGLQKSFLDRHVNQGASGGERKKLEMASLLMMNAKLAFLDEIDSGVDIDAIKALAKGMELFLSRGDTSIILVSHGNALIKYIEPTHVHIFSEGRIIESGGASLAHKIHDQGFSDL